MKSYSNLYLKVGANIVLTPRLDDVLSSIDIEFKDSPQRVTSAVRVAEDQLRIVRKYLKSKGLAAKYPAAMTCGVDDKAGDQYVWQMAWSNLLNVGVIVNPPRACIALMDYFRNGVNKKGNLINESPHTRKTAFDIAGVAATQIVEKLVAERKIKSFLIERENNCTHVDIIP